MKESRIQFNIRMTISLKEKLRKLADEMDVSMREIIEHLINKTPVENKREKRERFSAIHTLSKEINYIGKNINQITIAIRQLNAGKKIPDGEFEMLVQELKKYNEKRREISELLGKNLF